MYLVTKEDFETVISNENLKYYLNLDSLQKDSYLKIYSMYNNLLMQYIMKYWGIKRYDEQMLKSSNNFSKVSPANMDVYQLCSKDFFDYYYLRNNIYIQRLNYEEINYLVNRYNNEQFSLDNDAELFIKNTFDKVIFEKTDVVSDYMFGPNESLYIKPSNSIIIGVRYDSSILPNQSKEEWADLYRKQRSELYFFSRALEKELSRILQCPVSIIEYNDFSVKKKLNESDNNLKH